MALSLHNMGRKERFSKSIRGAPGGRNYKERYMDIQFRSRNNDMGAYFPTFQERVNSMLPAEGTAAAPELQSRDKAGMTPHTPSNEEIMETLAQVEQQAMAQSEELIQAHSGLNEQRVARLLGLLD